MLVEGRRRCRGRCRYRGWKDGWEGWLLVSLPQDGMQQLVEAEEYLESSKGLVDECVGMPVFGVYWQMQKI